MSVLSRTLTAEHHEQAQAALALANETRQAGKALRAELASGVLSFADALADPRAAHLRLTGLLTSRPGWGEVGALAETERVGASERTLVRNLTARQIGLLSRPPEVRARVSSSAAPCELLRFRVPRSGRCAFRRPRAGIGQEGDMVPFGPLLRFLELPGWEPLRSGGQGVFEGRYSALPNKSPERRRVTEARRSGWIGESIAERILLDHFDDVDLAIEWWGVAPTPTHHLCSVCGEEMLHAAPMCGFCEFDQATSRPTR